MLKGRGGGGRILNIAAESRNYRWHVITRARIYFTCTYMTTISFVIIRSIREGVPKFGFDLLSALYLKNFIHQSHSSTRSIGNCSNYPNYRVPNVFLNNGRHSVN